MLRPQIEHYDGGLVFKHGDAYTTGIPDVSVTCNRKTSWWETKLADPKVNMKGRGLQHVNMRRLAVAGSAYYVIYEDHDGVCSTSIVEPRRLLPNGTFTALEAVCGWDHQFVVKFIKRVHGL